MLVTTPKQPGGSESMQFAVSGYSFCIADLEGLVPGSAVVHLKHSVTQVAPALAVVVFDGSGHPGDARGSVVFGRLEETGLAALERDQHLVSPSDGGLKRLALASPQLMGKITAGFLAAPDNPHLVAEPIGFGDVLNFCHCSILR